MGIDPFGKRDKASAGKAKQTYFFRLAAATNMPKVPVPIGSPHKTNALKEGCQRVDTAAFLQAIWLNKS